MKIPNVKLLILLEYQNIKIFLQRVYFPNWPEEAFVIQKVQNTVPGTYVINDLNVEEIVGTFYKKELQKTNKKEFKIEKVIKKKVINYMLNGKDTVIHLIVG